ncbi:hypothetical protein FRC02_009912 [Tulasnella sp. 418]|nr:hypothetical protein FRC02_009912 [Tulasnella sp. 418]
MTPSNLGLCGFGVPSKVTPHLGLTSVSFQISIAVPPAISIFSPRSAWLRHHRRSPPSMASTTPTNIFVQPTEAPSGNSNPVTSSTNSARYKLRDNLQSIPTAAKI